MIVLYQIDDRKNILLRYYVKQSTILTYFNIFRGFRGVGVWFLGAFYFTMTKMFEYQKKNINFATLFGGII